MVDVWGTEDQLSNTYAITKAETFTFTTDAGPVYYIPVTTYPEPSEFTVDIDGLPQYVDEHFGYVKAERKITFPAALPTGLNVHIRVAATAIIQAPDFPVQPTPFGNAIIGAADANEARSVLELGAAATADIGSGPGQVSAGEHLHDTRYSQLGHAHAYEPAISAPVSTEGKFWGADKIFKTVPAYLTGVVSGCAITATPGGTTFSIASGILQFVDDYTTPGTTTATRISINAQSGIADTYAASPQTYVGINSSGAIVQQTTPFTSLQHRTIVALRVLAKSAGLIIASSPIQTSVSTAWNFSRDLARALGPVTSGITYSGVAASLQLARSGGSIFRAGDNSDSSTTVPDEVTLAAQSPVNFAIYSRNNSNTVWSNSGILTTLNPAVYDNGGASTNGIPGASLATNNWQAIRIWCSPNGNTLLQYGAVSYNSLTAAQSGVASEVFYPAPITQILPFRGYLFVRGGASNLASAGDAVFQAAGKLGDVGGASGSIGTVDLASQVTGVLPVLNGGTGTATPNLVAGANVTITGSWPNQTIAAATSGGTGVAQRINRNGNFAIWQKGLGPFTTSGMCADGFVMVPGTATVSVTGNAVTPGTSYGTTRPKYTLRWNQTGAGTGAYLQTYERDVRLSDNRSLTVSFYAFVEAGTAACTCYLQQQFGTGGSSAINITAQNLTLTTTPTKFTFTFTCPSVAGKTITSDSNISAFITFPNATFAAQFSEFQVEVGATANPFMELSEALEIEWCQRYFWRFKYSAANGPISSGFWGSTTSFRSLLNFPVGMVAVPVVTFSAAADFGALTTSTVIAGTNITSGNRTLTTALIDLTVASGGTAGQGGLLLWSTGATSSSYIDVTAG